MSEAPATISRMGNVAGPDASWILPRFAAREGETFDQIARRVASISPDDPCGIFESISQGLFTPGGQILRGAGVSGANLYNCFVSPVDRDEDERSIADRVSAWTRLGAGVGLDVSDWVERRNQLGDARALQRVAAAVAASQDALIAEGITRTATMINVRLGLPGLNETVLSLARPLYRHLNVGVLVSDAQMNEIQVSKADGSPNVLRRYLENLADVANATGNPGLIFVDAVNRTHPFDTAVTACNPCAEQHLEANEGCNLGSINVAGFVADGAVDWSGLRAVTAAAVRFLDSVVDANVFPSEEARRMAARRRRIGLGVMGLATAFEHLGYRYGSEASVAFARKVFAEIKDAARAESIWLGMVKADVPDDVSSRDSSDRPRNAYLTSVAPTGAISVLNGVSSGIEPIYASVFEKSGGRIQTPVSDGSEAVDVGWSEHVDMLATVQSFIDNGISKTINLSRDSTARDVMNVFVRSWQLGCKGISVFRVGSREPALRRVS